MDDFTSQAGTSSGLRYSLFLEGASHVFPHSSIVGACRLPIRRQGSILPDRSKVTVGHDEKLHDTCFLKS